MNARAQASPGIRIFVATPSSERFAPVREVAREVVEALGAEAWMAGDELQMPLRRVVDGADLAIVDLTDKDADVMYALGLIHSRRLPVVLMMDLDAPGPLPANLVGFLYYPYDRDNLEQLRRDLTRACDATIEHLRSAS